jgi:hypothetical protein
MGLVRRFFDPGPRGQIAVRLLVCFGTFAHSVQRVDPMVQAKSRTRRRIGYQGEQNGQFALLAAVGHRSPQNEKPNCGRRVPPCAEL